MPAEGRPKNQLEGSPNFEKSGGFLYSVYMLLLAENTAEHSRECATTEKKNKQILGFS